MGRQAMLFPRLLPGPAMPWHRRIFAFLRLVILLGILSLVPGNTLSILLAQEDEPPPPIYFSEVMVHPRSVTNAAGEWFELYNAGTQAVNLLGWQLTDLGRDAHTIQGELWIQPGAFALLARHGDFAANGGVRADYVYSGLQLANSADALLLLTPWGQEADRVEWGSHVELPIRPGRALERVWPLPPDPPLWVLAAAPWPDSAGDWGTPGQPFVPRVPIPTPTPIQTPDLGERWQPVAAPGPLVIDQVYYHGADLEFVTLLNRSPSPVDLTGYIIGDAERPLKQEGLYELPPGLYLLPGARFVLARHGAHFRQQWGQLPHAEIENSLEDVPTLTRRRDLATGVWGLNDDGDEIVLLTPDLYLADAVVYGSGDYAQIGVTGPLVAGAGESLQRVPGAWFPGVTDQRHRLIVGPVGPFSSRDLPAGSHQPPIMLDDGLVAAWGSLGVPSNFSPQGIAPPHYLMAAAVADGLDFLAIADDLPQAETAATALQPWAFEPAIDPAYIPAIDLIPAWRWQGNDGHRAIVYSQTAFDATTWEELLHQATINRSIVQGTTPVAARSQSRGLAPAIIQADHIVAPDGTAPLYRAWAEFGQPLLPGGNRGPTLPGVANSGAQLTGLALTHPGVEGTLAALRARRGWLASRPGIWLTLRTAEGIWMGEHMSPANQATFAVHYGDRFGAPAGLTLWQDDRPIRSLDTPPPDGRWIVTVEAVPGAFFYVVATLRSGDFAVTAPIQVASVHAPVVLINEILAQAGQDYNHDGTVDSGDSFIELWNPAPYPISLAGWQLTDIRGDESPGHRYTFDPHATIPGHGHLLVWRAESRISLNAERDWVRLLDPQHREVDRMAWQSVIGRDKAIARLPDGGDWIFDAPPTPGTTNRGPAPASLPPPAASVAPTRGSTPAQAQAHSTLGQATGPPGSLAMEKLRGLGEWVEFRGQVTVPPGLFNAAIYVAEPARLENGQELPIAGLGIQVYLHNGGQFAPFAEGDWVLVRGRLRSYRGELEVQVAVPDHVRYLEAGTPLQPLATSPAGVGESLEGRLITLRGVVVGWQGDSIYLADLDDPQAEAVRVSVRSSLDWRRPFVQRGEIYQATGVLSQFAQRAPWNGGYRLLVRYPHDLIKIEQTGE